MEYTKKHKNLIAKLFKKAGMLEEANIVLSCDAAKKANIPIGANPALLDAARLSGQRPLLYILTMLSRIKPSKTKHLRIWNL